MEPLFFSSPLACFAVSSLPKTIWQQRSSRLLLRMTHYLDVAEKAAHAAGELLRQNFNLPRRVNSAEAHDIKLAIDVETQELITDLLLKEFPNHALYGEEGIVGDQSDRKSTRLNSSHTIISYAVFCLKK